MDGNTKTVVTNGIKLTKDNNYGVGRFV